jgi:hypothetical protein
VATPAIITAALAEVIRGVFREGTPPASPAG